MALAIQSVIGINLQPWELAFALEYTQDFDLIRACRAVGVTGVHVERLMEDERIAEAIRAIMLNRQCAGDLNVTTVKEEMLSMYYITKQTANYGQALKALDMIAKHCHVDAYAAQKVAISGDEQIALILQKGRQRARESSSEGFL